MGLYAATTFSTILVSARTQSDVPTLDRVLALARERAPELMVARAEVEASRSVGVGARVSPLPNPHLEVIAERGGRGVTRDVYIIAQLHTPIEVGGQRGRRIAEADSFVEWHTANLEQLRAQISRAAVRSYGESVAHAARFETLNELLTSAGTEASVLGARRDTGDASEHDAQLAEVERARIAVQLEETQASLRAALNELERLTGRRFTASATTQLVPNVDLNVPELSKILMATVPPPTRSVAFMTTPMPPRPTSSRTR